MTWLQFSQAVAFTVLFVTGSIFDWMRKGDGWKDKLLACPLCFGFWVGLVARIHAGHLWQVPVPTLAFAPVLVDIVLWGALVGVASYGVHLVFERLGK